MTKLIYLATPYSKFRDGLIPAFECACEASAELIARGFVTYSPIVQTHAIAKRCGLDPLDHALWMKFNAAMMGKADELWIVKMPGWNESAGIVIERATFELAGKPERMLSWPALEFEKIANQ